MIEATGLVKRYGDKVAVDDVSFRVPPGVVTGFLGPNGAGTSTTMRMIIGLDAPSGGSVTVNGRNVAGGIGVFVGVILVVPVIASALPQTWGDRINKWLPSNAGQALMSFESDNTTLSPWRGFIVFCLDAIATVTIAAVLLCRRDA